MTRTATLGVALLGLCLTVAACSSANNSAAHSVTTKQARKSATVAKAAGTDPKLVRDAQAVASDLSSLTSAQSALEQLAPTVSSESQTLSQLVTDANDGEHVCSSQLSSQSSSLSFNADALDGAAQTVSNDITQLNSAETTYRTLERAEPSEAPATAPSFYSVLNAGSSAGGDLGEAGAERGAASLALQEASGTEMSSDC